MAYDGQSTSSTWPGEPYKGLQYYSVEDRRLFFGRQADIDTCMHRLTSIETRIVLLHGLTGCGKSSFLRAGLIPSVEDDGPGYYFLRDDDDRPLFIRCGHDPLGRLAEDLFRLAQKPIALRGTNQRFDISGCLQGHQTREAFVDACRKPRVLCRVLQAMARIVPATLVIVLDQAEEVITALDDGDQKRRLQFFRFIREFSAVNFPVKLVVALRSEYSGQFIELGLYDGSVDLRGATLDENESSRNAEAGIPVRSDLKLFHLRELGREEVRQAIELPTSDSEAHGNPFATYRFRYAPGVAQRIVDDLFDTSTTAVLPAMQLTCRDLYKNMPPDREIREKQYVDGGRISGPVDRHVSKSLRDCFATLPPNEMAAEEQRWRDLLCHLVHGESDGTVRTRIISVRELKDCARKIGVLTDVDSVVDRLVEPNVLLLRNVTPTVDSAVDSSDDKKLSLGHDFIGMVLHRWRATEEATRIAKQNIEAIRRRAIVLGLAAIGVIVIASALFLVAKTFGAADERYNVLVNRARYMEKSDYRASMLASAQAMTLAKDWRFDDDEARTILARIVAGRPDAVTSKPRAANTQTSGSTEFFYIFPLRQSNGFVTIQNDTLLISSGGKERTVRLKRTDDPNHLPQYPAQYKAVETGSGTILVVRSAYRFSTNGDNESYSQIHVIGRDAEGEIAQAISSERLLRKTDEAWTAERVVREFGASASPIVDIDRSVITVSMLKEQGGRRAFWLRGFSFDEDRKAFVAYRAKLDEVPVRLGNDLILGPFRVGTDIVVPEPTSAEDGSLKLTRYAWPQNPTARDSTMTSTPIALPAGQAWQWLGSSESRNGSFLFFATRSFSEEDIYGNISFNKLRNFAKFYVVGADSKEGFAFDVQAIHRARQSCGVEAASSGLPAGSAGSSTDALFFAQHDGLPLIVVSNAQSAELVEIKGNGDATCLGSLLFPEPMESWAVTEDGAHLLGTSKGVGMRWSLRPSLRERERKLAEDATLLDSACASDLGALIGNMGSRDWPHWSTVPDLPDKLTRGLCDAATK